VHSVWLRQTIRVFVLEWWFRQCISDWGYYTGFLLWPSIWPCRIRALISSFPGALLRPPGQMALYISAVSVVFSNISPYVFGWSGRATSILFAHSSSTSNVSYFFRRKVYKCVCSVTWRRHNSTLFVFYAPYTSICTYLLHPKDVIYGRFSFKSAGLLVDEDCF